MVSLRFLAVTAVLVAGLAVPSVASAAYTTGSVNLRSGPGTGYRVITTVPRGGYVDVRKCVPRWCGVVYRGIYGWVSAAYVGRGGPRYGAPRPYYPPRGYYYRPYAQPYYYPRPYTYYPGPGFTFGYGLGFGGFGYGPWW